MVYGVQLFVPWFDIWPFLQLQLICKCERLIEAEVGRTSGNDLHRATRLMGHPKGLDLNLYIFKRQTFNGAMGIKILLLSYPVHLSILHTCPRQLQSHRVFQRSMFWEMVLGYSESLSARSGSPQWFPPHAGRPRASLCPPAVQWVHRSCLYHRMGGFLQSLLDHERVQLELVSTVGVGNMTVYHITYNVIILSKYTIYMFPNCQQKKQFYISK